jgi:hypothetical protein
MPPVTFALNKPVDTPTASVEAVVAGLPPGTTCTFQLVVIDDLGQESAPVTATVEIQAAPVAKITAPKTAGAGKSFSLDATGSTPQGQIKTYRWTLTSTTPPAPGP